MLESLAGLIDSPTTLIVYAIIAIIILVLVKRFVFKIFKLVLFLTIILAAIIGYLYFT